MAENKVPRGIRNNNPLNIRKGSNWLGERFPQSDKSFEEFESMEYGIRAGMKLLRQYITGYNGRTRPFNTIEKIIRRWAPPFENATDKYIDYVAKRMGISARTPIKFTDRKSICALVASMIEVECGQPIDPQMIESGYDLL